jgi:N-acetylmuramoyl-L-alanine amidase
MYSGRDDDYYDRRDEAELRKQFRRRLRLKRFLAALILVLGAALVCFLLFLLGKGIVSFFKSGSSGSEYVEEVPGVQLEVVDNVFTPEDLLRLFGKADTADSTGTVDNNGADSTGTGDAVDNTGQTGNTDTEVTTDTERHLGLIAIDAGHGGMDSGTYNGEILEKNINLQIALKLRDELKNRGYSVYMTRDDDTYVGLQKRAELVNSQDNVLAFVSIHQNAVDSDKSSIYGIEGWTYKREGCGELAELVVNHVCDITGAKNRGYAFKTNLVVTSKTTMPAVLLECGFLSNDDECAKLASEDYQKLIARGIADAIDEFTKTHY